jgi:hypothetical protein
MLRQLELLRMQEELLKKEEDLLLEAANLGETQPLSAPGAPRVAGYQRPHPLLPLNKRLDADEWEMDEDLLPEEQELLEQLGALPFHPAGHRRSASRNAHGADNVLPQAPVSLGLEGVEQRLGERRMVQASKTFMLVHRVVEQEETRTPSAQLLHTLPLGLQHLFNSVGVSEDLLPDVSLRRHVAAPPSSGSRIKCPSSTAQGKPLDRHVVHSALRARGTGTAPAHRKYGAGPKRGERVRKHLVMCAIKGTKFEFWKSHKVVDLIGGDAQEELAAPARPYRGCIELTSASRVEVDRMGYCMKVHVVYLSSDKNDAVTDTHTFLQAPEDMEPRSDLSAVAQQLTEAIASLRSDSGRMVEFNSDPVKPWLKSKKTAPPLWEGPLQPPGFEDAELLDGYIPHFLADDSGLSRQLQPENAAFAEQFDRRKHQLWAALHKLKQTQAGSKEATLTVQQLLQRQGGAAAVCGVSGSRSSGEGGGGGDDSLVTDGGGSFGGKAISKEDVVGGVSEIVVVERKVEELDFSQYREGGDAAEVWDVEFAHGTLALRHTLNGMTLLMSTASADVVCALVTAGGDEFFWAEAVGLSERQLSGREREVVLTFASRYIAAAATHVEEGAPVALSRGWKVQHAWQDVHAYGNWSLQAPSDVRCVALNSLDLGASVHLLANGFVILGRSRALLHLMTRQGPVGPVIVPSAQAVQVFVDEEKDRADAPHNLCAWRPLAQLSTTDIQQLKQEQLLVAVGVSMPPINLTVAGQPPFSWTVVPRLPPGIHIKVVDHHSAQVNFSKFR